MGDATARTNRPRLIYIDALRAVGALSVFFVHGVGILAVTIDADPRSVAGPLAAASGYGYLGVDLFFVISGFVIAYSIGDDRVTPGYAGRFAVRRALRLDPPYWCAIVVGILWIVLRQKFGNRPEAMPTAPELLSHLVYLQNILGQGQVVVVFWTLCLEVQLYLAFILLLMLSRWWPARARVDLGYAGATATLCAFVLSMAWPVGLFGDNEHFAPGVFLAWFPPTAFRFLAGASVAYVALGRLRAAHVAAALGLLALVLVADIIDEAHPFALNAKAVSVLATLVTAASLLLAARVGGLATWLGWPPLLFVGSLSYSFYLLHVPVIGLVGAVQKRSGWTSLASSAGFLLLAIVLTLAGAYVFYRLVERPSMRLARRIGKTAAVTPPALRPGAEEALPPEYRLAETGESRPFEAGNAHTA